MENQPCHFFPDYHCYISKFLGICMRHVKHIKHIKQTYLHNKSIDQIACISFEYVKYCQKGYQIHSPPSYDPSKAQNLSVWSHLITAFMATYRVAERSWCHGGIAESRSHPCITFLFWAGPDTATPWKSDPTPIWPAHGIGHCKFHPRGLDDNLPCLESKRLREWLDKPGKDSKQESWGNQKMQQNSTWGLMGGNQPVLQVHVIPNTTKT